MTACLADIAREEMEFLAEAQLIGAGLRGGCGMYPVCHPDPLATLATLTVWATAWSGMVVVGRETWGLLPRRLA